MGRRRLELSRGLTACRLHGGAAYRLRRAPLVCAAGVAWLLAAANGQADAAAIVALYNAHWAGLPAGEIRLNLSDSASSYRDRIEIQAVGLPAFVTHFRATAEAEGHLVNGRPADPARYDAVYDLRKRRNSRVAMQYVWRDGVSIAERGPDDTSRKPPLAEKYRRGIVDPLAALECIRAAVTVQKRRPGASFEVPVYDGARRFDILGRILPTPAGKPEGVQVELNLRPIAGFRGESSDDGDPDDAPRPVALTLSDDARLLPVAITVRVFYLPLVLRLDRVCADIKDCSR